MPDSKITMLESLISRVDDIIVDLESEDDEYFVTALELATQLKSYLEEAIEESL